MLGGLSGCRKCGVRCRVDRLGEQLEAEEALQRGERQPRMLRPPRLRHPCAASS